VRILVLNQYFHPDVASTSRLLTELCEDLARHHEVTVVCGRPSYDPVEHRPPRGLVSEDRHEDVRVLRTWSTRFGRGSMAGRLANYSTYLASSLLGAALASKPDVVLTMTDPPVVAAAAASVAWARRVPYVYVVQDLFPQVGVALGRIKNRTVVRSLERLNRSLRSRAGAVVAIGRDMAQALRGLGVPEDRLRIISNWADADAIQPSTAPSALRRRLGLEDAFVVMHSGNVGLSQELDTLLEAARAMSDEADIHFLIAGNGAAKPALVRRARGWRLANVSFVDYQPQAQLSESLGTADLHAIGLRRGLGGLIVPSKVYGIMAAGRPFVAAVERSSEVALVAEEAGCGIRVEPGDPDALASAILELKQDGARRDDMGRRGREELERRYERSIASGRYRDLLERIAGA